MSVTPGRTPHPLNPATFSTDLLSQKVGAERTDPLEADFVDQMRDAFEESASLTEKMRDRAASARRERDDAVREASYARDETLRLTDLSDKFARSLADSEVEREKLKDQLTQAELLAMEGNKAVAKNIAHENELGLLRTQLSEAEKRFEHGRIQVDTLNAAASDFARRRAEAVFDHRKMEALIANLKTGFARQEEQLLSFQKKIRAVRDDRPGLGTRLARAISQSPSNATLRLIEYAALTESSNLHNDSATLMADGNAGTWLSGFTHQRDPMQRADSLHDLLEWNELNFVRCAYVTMLGRRPDPLGQRHYLELLAAGREKTEILWQLRRSKEGSSHDPGIAGLDKALRSAARQRWKFVGPIFALFSPRIEPTASPPGLIDTRFVPGDPAVDAPPTPNVEPRIRTPAGDELKDELGRAKTALTMPNDSSLNHLRSHSAITQAVQRKSI